MFPWLLPVEAFLQGQNRLAPSVACKIQKDAMQVGHHSHSILHFHCNANVNLE